MSRTADRINLALQKLDSAIACKGLPGGAFFAISDAKALIRRAAWDAGIFKPEDAETEQAASALAAE